MIVSLGGQTPLKLAHALRSARASRSSARRRRRSTRPRIASSSTRCANGSASRNRPAASRLDGDDAVAIAHDVGYPVLVRPSYVLGGRAMEIVYDDADLRRAMGELAHDRLARPRRRPLGGAARARRPVPRRRGRGRRRRAARPHRRRASSAGSWSTSRRRACTRATPRARSRRRRCRRRCSQTIEAHTRALADALERRRVCCNVQFAVKDGQVFVIEANPRASRTVPFVSKATGVPLAKVAARAHGRRDARRAARRRAAAPAGRRRPRLDQGSGAAVQPLPRRRHAARSGDAFDRRGHGDRPHVRHGVRQEPGRRGQHAAAEGRRVPLARGPRQGSRARRGAPLRRARLLDRGHRKAPPTTLEANGDRRSTRSSPRSARRSGRRRGRSDLVGQGRPRREHAAGPGPARRRHAHPPGRDRARRRRASRRSPRRSRPRPASPRRSAGSPRCGRCRATTATASCGWRCECVPPPTPRAATAVDLDGRRSGPVALPNPIVAASGTFGHGDELARALRSARARRGHDEVGRRVPVAGQSAAARHRDRRRRDAELGRACRARASTRGSRATCPRSKRTARE